MALDSFRRIVIEIDTANDYIAPIILSRGDVNGRTLVVKLTDNGKPVTNTDGLVVKLAYRSAGQTSGWVKTMAKVNGYDTAAWSCSAPGSVLSSEYAIMCIQICQGSDVVCSRTFRAAVDKPIINLSPGTDEGDAVKALQEILASLDDQQAKFDAAEKKREQDFKSAATSASTAAEKANSAATGATAAKEAADTAAKKANTAGDDALAAKAKADSAASKANAAATKAEAAASSANSAADGLVDIKQQASEAATNANNAADRVDASIESANTAAAAANEAASSVKAAGSLASSAAAKADDAAAKALSASTSANSAANSASSAADTAGSAASTAGRAADEAESAATKASASANKADIAAGKANEATVAATNAATKANEVEAKLTGNILKENVKDTFVHVDDAFPSTLLGIEIEGACRQDGTPSPDNPAPIEVVEHPVVQVRGRNLLNTELLNDENNFNKSQSGLGFWVYKFVAPSTGNYTVSVKQIIHDDNYLMVSDSPLPYASENRVWFSHLTAVGTKTSATFKNVNAIYLYFNTDIARIQSAIEKVGGIQIEKGPTATALEPYVSQSQAFTLPAEHSYLAKLPDGTTDEIVVDKDGNVELVARVMKTILDGSIFFNDMTFEGIDTYYETSKPIGNGKLPDTQWGGLYDRFVTDNPYTLHHGACAFCFSAFDGIIFRIRPSETFANVEDFNNWIKSNPVTSYHADTKPKTYNLGKIEMPKAQDSIINVWTDAEVMPNTTISYVRDMNIVVENLESAIASIS